MLVRDIRSPHYMFEFLILSCAFITKNSEKLQKFMLLFLMTIRIADTQLFKESCRRGWCEQ